MPQPLAAALRDKILEQIERTEHLIQALPDNGLDWSPPMDRPWTTATLLRHLMACLMGFCAALYAADPERLAHFQALRHLPPVPETDRDEVRKRMQLIRQHITEGLDGLADATLAQRIPTVFVPAGEPVITLLLGNLEHLINHKHQLFTYLRLMGVPVESQDLYQFRS